MAETTSGRVASPPDWSGSAPSPSVSALTGDHPSRGGKATEDAADPTYQQVIDRAAMFPEGMDLEALHAHFLREIDRGRYEMRVIRRVHAATAAHVRRALDNGDADLTNGLRFRVSDERAKREDAKWLSPEGASAALEEGTPSPASSTSQVGEG